MKESARPTVVPAPPAESARPPAPPAAPTKAPNILLITMGLLIAVGVVMGIIQLLQIGTERTDDANVFSENIPLSARANSQVSQVLVHDDQVVKKGDVLIVLDDRVAAIQVAQAEAELDTARAQQQASAAQVNVVKAQAKGGLRSAQAALDTSRQQISQVESRISAAEADVQRAEQEALRATTEFERVQKLFATALVSQSQLDDARVAQEIARAALARTRAQLAEAQNEKQLSASRVVEAQGHLDQSSPSDALVLKAQAEADLATARVASAEHALEMARLQRTFLNVVAPRDGMVSKLSVREGQFVQVGQLLLQIVPPSTTIVANFKETQIQNIHIGQRVAVYVDAFPDKPLEGEVSSIAGGTGASFSLLPPNNATGNFVKVVQRVPIRITLKEPSAVPLAAGLSVEVVVHIR